MTRLGEVHHTAHAHVCMCVWTLHGIVISRCGIDGSGKKIEWSKNNVISISFIFVSDKLRLLAAANPCHVMIFPNRREYDMAHAIAAAEHDNFMVDGAEHLTRVNAY